MKNKIFVLAFWYCLFLIPTAYADSNPVVEVSSVIGQAGETVEIAVSLEACNEFANLGIEIGYDSNYMTLIEEPSSDVGAMLVCAQSLDKNPYNMIWNGISPIIYNGVIATLKFSISQSAPPGTYPVTVSYFKGRDGNYIDGLDTNYDSKGNALKIQYKNGAVTVEAEEEPEIDISDIVISFSVKLSAYEKGGAVIAALYDNTGHLITTKMYPAAEEVEVKFNQSGDYIKIMWWEPDKMKPITKAIYKEV